MQSRKFPILETIAAVALVAIATTVLFLLFPAMKSEVVASWVQAVGSIGAILAAFVLGERQVKAGMAVSAAAQDADAERRRMAILAIADAAYNGVSSVKKHYLMTPSDRAALRIRYNGRIFSGLIDALSAVPLLELGDPQAVAGLLGMRSAMVEMQDAIESYLSKPMPPANAMYPEAVDAEDSLRISMQKVSFETAFGWLQQVLQPTRLEHH